MSAAPAFTWCGDSRRLSVRLAEPTRGRWVATLAVEEPRGAAGLHALASATMSAAQVTDLIDMLVSVRAELRERGQR